MYFYLVRGGKTKWEKYRCGHSTDLDFNLLFSSCLTLASYPEFLVSSSFHLTGLLLNLK